MKDWFLTFVVGLVIALAVNLFVLQAYRVDGHSMVPTLHNREYTLLYKLPRAYHYNNIVVIDSRVKRPRTIEDRLKENALLSILTGKHETYLWIKRVVGLPGDTLKFENNHLYRNGRLLKEPYINEPMKGIPDHVVHVPPGDIFVMGDNRNHSTDSRVIGPVPLTHVLGKVIFKK